MAWYLVHCNPWKETYAAHALADVLGLSFFLPEVLRQRRGKLRRSPFFPGYIFIWADLHKVEASEINTMPGVRQLVAFGDEPHPVPDDVIEYIRQRVDILNARGGLVDHRFRPGDAVQLKEGPLRGLEAIFVGPMKPSERVQVLINFLGAQRKLEVEAEALEPIRQRPARRDAPRPHHPKRRQRYH